METKTWAKRVAALSTGALMLGATMMGAMAAYDLGTYPEPFVKDGVLSDTVLVVGAVADSADVLGAVDIAAGLQAAAKTPAGSGSATAPTTDDGVKVEKSGDKFNYGDDVYDVHPEVLDETDMEDLLAQGTFEDDEGDNTGDEDYDQELQFADGNIDFNQYTPEDGMGGNYVRIEDGDALYTYTLEFDDSVSFDSTATDDDFTGAKLEIMGKVYTITDADSDGSGLLDTLTLTSGDSTVWLTQDHPLEFGGDTITVVDVGNDGTKCGVDVNGHVEWISEGSTSDAFPSDLSVGVLEVIETASEGENACELSLGSAELVFEEGQEVTMNDDTIDGTEVAFQGTANDWTGFTVTYTVDVDVDTDDVYLAEGDAWTDPVFGSWKVEYAGVTADNEEMNWKSTGEDSTFTFVNKDGEEVEIAWHYNDATSELGLGYDDDEPLLLPGDSAELAVHQTSNPENVRILFTTAGGEAHVLRFESVDCADSTTNETTIVDETYGKEYTEEINCFAGNQEALSIGSLGSATLNITSDNIEYVSDGGGSIETEFEGVMVFTDTSWKFTEDKGDEQNANNVYLNQTWDSDDDEIFYEELTNTTVAYSGVEKEDGDDDVKLAKTAKGTLLEFDNDEKLSVMVWAPEEDAFANVFVTPLTAKITSGAASGDAYQVNAFEVGLAVLDSDAEGMNKNMIIVGGPCANTLAMEVMDATKENCGAGFEEGKAMIKYFDRNGKAALLVAGYEARDTRGASYVLADYKEYELSGDEVEVVSTNLEDLKVNKV